MRPFSSANVCSVSSCLGISMAASRATAPFAVSQAICTWRVSGYMSGNRRAPVMATGSIFFASQYAWPLSRSADRLRSMPAKRGALT